MFNYLPVFPEGTAGFYLSGIMAERVMIFIDGSNFYHSLTMSFNSAKIDIEKFCEFVVGDDDLVRIFYYTAPLHQKDNVEAYKSQQKFFSALQRIKRLKLFLGRLERRDNSHIVEKGVDVKLVVDLLVNAYENKYDKAILVSNDADFVPAIEEVQNLNKKVVNVNFPKTRSFHLDKVCDSVIKIESIKDFLIK